MDPEEIDSWYDEQKEIIFEKFINEKESDKNAEVKYKKDMQKLRKKYENLVEKDNKKIATQKPKKPVIKPTIFSRLIAKIKKK